MGSAALAADVPYPGKEIRISRNGQSVLKKKKKKIADENYYSWALTFKGVVRLVARP